jgi:hypothetical protein
VRYHGHGAGGEGSEAVVHDLEVQALQVRDVARDVERQDLTPALLQEVVAAGPAIHDETALRGTVLLVDDVLMSFEEPPVHRQALDSLPLLP